MTGIDLVVHALFSGISPSFVFFASVLRLLRDLLYDSY